MVAPAKPFVTPHQDFLVRGRTKNLEPITQLQHPITQHEHRITQPWPSTKQTPLYNPIPIERFAEDVEPYLREILQNMNSMDFEEV
jgi:hypothetical protein